jgi:hypothetical protein
MLCAPTFTSKLELFCINLYEHRCKELENDDATNITLSEEFRFTDAVRFERV